MGSAVVAEQTAAARRVRRTLVTSSWLWLALAAGLVFLANGNRTAAVAAWLAPVFLLRFVRTRRVLLGLPLTYAVLAGAGALQLVGLMPLAGVQFYLFVALCGIPFVLPYAADRLLAGRLGGLAAATVFPTSWAATEYLLSLSPGGTWGSTAYTQYGNLPLLQLLSVTGPWGVTFLVGWFATACNGLWEEGPGPGPARTGAALFAGTMAVVLLLGGARLALWPPAGLTVRVASLSREGVGVAPGNATWQRLRRNEATEVDVREYRRWAQAVGDDLLERTRREARAGARIVFWGEGNAPVLEEDEAALIDRGRELCQQYQVYLGMALSTWTRGQARPRQNKVVLIGPSGQVAWQYLKTYPVPGGEALTVPGDGVVRALDTPLGRISAVICLDADFPQLVRQAGILGADILLDPASDWKAIDPMHTHMASFRAIELGVNLVRQTSEGLSAAYDYQGRVLAAMDHYHTKDHVMVAQVPTAGVRTVYSRVGDVFAWLCCGAVVVLAAKAFARPRVARA
jgi:apolipoprotein N-acyltransferase